MGFESLRGFVSSRGGGLAGTREGRLNIGFLGLSKRQKIEAHLSRGGSACLYIVEIDNFRFFLSLYGEEVATAVSESAREELKAILKERSGEIAFGYLDVLEPGRFVILAARTGLGGETLADASWTMRLRVKGRLKPEALKLTGQVLEVSAGYSLISSVGRAGLEHMLYNALCDAQQVSKGALDPDKLMLLGEFRDVVSLPRIRTVYQPIVDFELGSVLAWEALSRGPKGHYFENPAPLFDFAEEIGEVFSLERACRETAVANFGRFDKGQKLFLNIHPRTLVAPNFSPGETVRLLAEHGLTPDDVILEITERHSIRDFTLFHRTLEHYRGQGFKVAVDDVGTGYSGLWSIAELRPDFIKVDMSLVRNIDQNPVKRALLETFVAFSEKIGCRLIAEGIETKTELTCLLGLGVHCGQGYYLARPDYPKPQPSRGVLNLARPATSVSLDLKCSIPVRQLAVPAHLVDTQVKVCDVKELLEGDDPISAIVVAENQRPRGLVMSHHMDRALSTRYGMSLYYQRSATRIMDPAPLVVEGGTPVEKVARMAMNRDKYKIYDHIIVTENGLVGGLVSVQNMLDTLASVQVEMAKGASPLTGLPGNVTIEQELKKRSTSGVPFSIIYADLDNFKIYNDTYGFKSGDNIIMLLSRILSWAVRRHGDGSADFTGHVGGDDFVLICRMERAERICQAVVRCFCRLVKSCYTEEHRKQGYIDARDRSGRPGRCPLVSVSLAVVDCTGKCDPQAIALRSAEMKKYAKSIAGNSWVRDRRSPLAND